MSGVCKSSNKRMGKNKLIGIEEFNSCFEISTGLLVAEVFGASLDGDLFALYVVGVRKCCGWTITQLSNLFKQKAHFKVHQALRKYANYRCSLSADYNPDFVLRLRSLVKLCRASSAGVSKAESMRRWRKKRALRRRNK